MRYLSIIAMIWAVIVLSGCNMKRWCCDRFPPTVKVDTTVVYRDSVIIEYKDTVVEVHLPGKTVYDTIHIPCPDPDPEIDLSQFTIMQETELCKARAWLDRYPVRMAMELHQKDTTLLIEQENAKKTILSLKEEISIIKKTQIHEKIIIPGFYKFTLYWFIWSLVMLLIIILLRRR